MKHLKQKPKIEFSKKILLIVMAFTFAITIFCCVMMFITQDLTPFAYLIPALFGEMGVGTAMYYEKAKKENCIKIEKAIKQDENKQSSIDITQEICVEDIIEEHSKNRGE